MKELPLGELYYEISRHNPPALSIQPGETVQVETEDTFNGLVRQEGDHRDLAKKPQGNPQSGPIWVEGAEKGDSLAVHIEKIDARIGQAANDMTWARRGLGEFLGDDIPRQHAHRPRSGRQGMVESHRSTALSPNDRHHRMRSRLRQSDYQPRR